MDCCDIWTNFRSIVMESMKQNIFKRQEQKIVFTHLVYGVIVIVIIIIIFPANVQN